MPTCLFMYDGSVSLDWSHSWNILGHMSKILTKFQCQESLRNRKGGWLNVCEHFNFLYVENEWLTHTRTVTLFPFITQYYFLSLSDVDCMVLIVNVSLANTHSSSTPAPSHLFCWCWLGDYRNQLCHWLSWIFLYTVKWLWGETSLSQTYSEQSTQFGAVTEWWCLRAGLPLCSWV